MTKNRRDFLKFSGSASLLPALTSISLGGVALAKSGTKSGERKLSSQTGSGYQGVAGAFKAIGFSSEDEISVASGFEWYPLLKTGDVINTQGDKAGDCCDYLHFFPGETADQGFIWVNHEYLVENVLYGRLLKTNEKTKEMVDAEMKLVGGSFVELKLEKDQWKVVSNSSKAFRLDANTEIPLVGPAGGKTAIGTLGNCGGGFTPWGTVLSGEENVSDYFHSKPGKGYGWEKFYQRSEEDYGWIVEVDVGTKKARKLTGMGRFAHEGATVTLSKDKRVVVYLGDDAKSQCLYKFVSKATLSGNPEKDKDLLVEGSLYVADFRNLMWILLSPEHPKLSSDQEMRFKTQADICLKTREAAQLVGGTRMNRPEDIKIHPQTGDIYFTLTNNADVGDFHGSVVRLVEDKADHSSTAFTYETHIVGGNRTGFSCPDNLTFGPGHSLWVCTDISGEVMGKGSHQLFARNSMSRLELDDLGNVYTRHFLQSPIDAEITGPCFLPDGKNLLLSIQHPGEGSFLSKQDYTSHWPGGANSKPVSTVIIVKAKQSNFG